MNEGENKPMDTPETEDWKARYMDLSRQIFLLRVTLLVASLTLTIFLGLQSYRMGHDVNAVRNQMQQIMDASKKESEFTTALVTKLVDYGQSHPDFMKILNKYPIKITQSPGASRPPGVPTPGATLPLPAPTTPKK